MAKDQGILTQVECFADMAPTPNYQFMDFPENRSWCLGMFNVKNEKDPETGEDTCPPWFKGEVNEPTTRIRPIDF